MCYFRSYLETKGASLSQSDDLLPYYALPYIPNPHLHPTFEKLFEENWIERLRQQLEAYLMNMESPLNMIEQPFLIELYKLNNSKIKDREKEYTSLEIKWKDAEKRNLLQSKQLAKLQEDCKILMAMLTDFIAALESAVKGNLTDLDEVLSSCMRHFPEMFHLQRSEESNNHNKQSNKDLSAENIGCHSVNATLDFEKIKNDLVILETKQTALLLQALRWNLTKQSNKASQIAILNLYIKKDILDCEKPEKYRKEFLEKIINSSTNLYQSFLRFINAIASLHQGAKYLMTCPEIIDLLQKTTIENDHDIISCNMALCTLMKMSERCEVRKYLIEVGIVEWMIKTLLEETFEFDYRSYCLIRLFTNLCKDIKTDQQYKEKLLELLNNLKIKFHTDKRCENYSHLKDKTINAIVSLQYVLEQILNATADLDVPTGGDEDETVKNDKDFPMELEIDLHDPVIGNINDDNLLKKYYSIEKIKSDTMSQFENNTDDKTYEKYSNLSIKTRRSKSVPLYVNINDEELSSKEASLEEPLTPKLDPEATEMVRKIIGEATKTLVEATNNCNPSPVHIKGLNSKEYALAFSSRPKILRTPEPGNEHPKSSTPLKRTFKIKKDVNSHDVSPKVASSSPHSPNYEQHSYVVTKHHINP